MTSYQRHTKKYELTNLYPFTCIQGPALYACNNSKFTKEDWRGIRLVCDSIKVEDPMKVGRFGLGFKSVFHMTSNAKYLPSKPKIKIVFWRFFFYRLRYLLQKRYKSVATSNLPCQRCAKPLRCRHPDNDTTLR